MCRSHHALDLYILNQSSSYVVARVSRILIVVGCSKVHLDVARCLTVNCAFPDIVPHIRKIDTVSDIGRQVYGESPIALYVSNIVRTLEHFNRRVGHIDIVLSINCDAERGIRR